MASEFRSELFRAQPTKSFAVNEVIRVTGRIFSITLLISGAETLLNAFSQLPVLNTRWAVIAMLALAATQIGVFIGAWFTSNPMPSQRLHAFAVLGIVLLWQFQVVDPSQLPANYQPWVWWALGAAAVSGAISMPFLYGGAYVMALPISWYFVHLTPAGGAATAQRSMQDALYVFLFSTCFSLLLILFRRESRKTDKANEQAAQAKANSAQIDAIEQERARVDALIHDKVLTALVVAAKADSKAATKDARALAANALNSLETAKAETDAGDDYITTYSLFGALYETYRPADSGFEFSETGASDLRVPRQVASALTEATFQAASNSLMHAGTGANRSISLRGTSHKIKIVIKDDGRGFRVSRVPKNRLGVRASIINRMQAVGGRAFIDSAPGKGTTVILEWSKE